MQRQWSNIVIIGLVDTLAVTIAQAQPGVSGGAMLAANTGTAFTYQGRLSKDGAPVQGVCDFQFTLWDSASGGTALGTTPINGVTVTGGLFTIPALDFGSNAFTGQARRLDVAVRCPAGSGSYTILTPRQPLTAAPYTLSLRPGAQIVGDVSGDSSLFAYNTITSGLSYGMYRRSDSPNGRGVAGFASASSGDAVGVFGLTASSNGRGVTDEAWATSGPAIGVYGVTRSAAQMPLACSVKLHRPLHHQAVAVCEALIAIAFRLASAYRANTHLAELVSTAYQCTGSASMGRCCPIRLASQLGYGVRVLMVAALASWGQQPRPAVWPMVSAVQRQVQAVLVCLGKRLLPAAQPSACAVQL